MARKIQSQSSHPQDGIGTFAGLLARAFGWLAAAILVPTGAIAAVLPPAAAPYVHWAPILFYALAFWTFTRALRALPGLAANGAAKGIAPLARKLGVDQAQSGSRPSQGRKPKPSAAAAVHRAPTVQRRR